MKKIGLFGGTFDPIHCGHIALARRVLETFSLDEIIFIPAGTPPHKRSEGVTDSNHRFSMVKKAISGESRFSVSDFEINRNEPNYSYITIGYFKERYPDDEIFFIIGGDSFRDLPLWKNYETLLSMCSFIVVSRAGVAPESYFEKYSGCELPPRVFFLKDFLYDVSSTEIRDRIAEGQEISSLMPSGVSEYIKTNKLYT